MPLKPALKSEPASTSKPERVTASDIVQALTARYDSAKGWCMMREVTPPKVNRRFDLLAITVFQSAPLQIHGIEIKVNRSDWLRELDNVSKSAELIARTSHYWLAAPLDVAHLSEIPPEWGFLAVKRGPDGVSARAVKRPTTRTPDIDPAFWRCMLLRLLTRLPPSDAEIKEAYNRGVREEEERQARFASKRRESTNTAGDEPRYEERMEAFLKAAGIHLGRFHPVEEFIKLGRKVRSFGLDAGVRYRGLSRNALENGRQQLDKLIAELDAVL